MALPPPSDAGTCIVTGASSGIGAEIARDLARRGRGVTLVARRGDEMRVLAADLVAAHGVRAEVVEADLADPDHRAALPGTLVDLGLTVDVLVNNAGLSTSGPVHRADLDAELRMVRVDVEAVVDLSTRFLRGLVARGAGGVLNVASVAAFQPLPGQAGYGGAKAFVLAYSQATAAELRGTGVAVAALCPGPVRTGFGETAGLSEAESNGALPSFMWVPAPDVARAGVEGLVRGRTVVIPGAANVVGAYAGRVTPKTVLLPLLARQHPALRRP